MKIYSNVQLKGLLQSDTSIKIGDDQQLPSVDNEDSIRYWKDSNNSYVDMVMQSDVDAYEWVNIVNMQWS